MPELKTRPNDADVTSFLNSIDNYQRKKDSFTILQIMSDLVGEKPVMWGNSIVGFGKYHYKYPSGRTGDWFTVGFSPRKQALTLYIMTGFNHYQELISRLGKYKIGKSCLYIKKLDDVDQYVLAELIVESAKYMKNKNSKEC